MEKLYSLEEIGRGVMVVDYTGGRGKFGAAYAGIDGVWHDQPMRVSNPFTSESEATAWADKQVFNPSDDA